MNAIILNLLHIKRIMKKYILQFAQLFSRLTVIINVSWAANQYIIMISEGSCNTEDWSNDAENTALTTGINYILQYIQIEKSYFKL